MSIITTSYQPLNRQSAVFDVIVDLEITVPIEHASRLFYINRLYRTEHGVSVVITDENNRMAACLYNCTTFDHPLAMVAGELVGVSAHILLADSVLFGELIDKPVEISKAFVSLYAPAPANTQTVSMYQDSDLIYNDVLTSDTELELSGILTGTLNGSTLHINMTEEAGAAYQLTSYTGYRPLRTINYQTPNTAGQIVVNIDTSLQVYDHTDCNVTGCTGTCNQDTLCGRTRAAVYVFHGGVGGSNNVRTAIISTDAIDVQLKPISIIDQYISPLKQDREFQYFVLDDFYTNGELYPWGTNVSVDLLPNSNYDDINTTINTN